jgi:hypothetical protein
MFGNLVILFLALFIYSNDSQILASEKIVLTQNQVDDLLASGRFKSVKSKSEIPKLWWEGMGLNGLSDIGGPFDPGCTGGKPHSRLIAAAVSQPFAVVVCEKGGRSHFGSLTVLKHVDGVVLSVYTENLQMADLPKLLEKLGK